MKKYFLIILTLLALISCGEEEVVIYDVDSGQTLAQLSATSAQLGTPAEGASVTVDVTVTTKSNTDRAITLTPDAASTATQDQYDISGLTIPAGAYVGTVTISSNFDALPDMGSTTLILNLTDVAGSNNIVFENETLTISLFRACPVMPGVWTINMQDAYGDGWQTSTTNGGPGITIELSTGEMFEIGLCTPYEANTYDCINEASSGSDTFTVPDGVEDATFTFPGDAWGEISFQIINPNGTTVVDYPPGSAAGPISVDFCIQ